MQYRDKLIFFLLCVLSIAVNGYLFYKTEHIQRSFSFAIGAGIGASIFSIPLWAGFGFALTNVDAYIIKPVHGYKYAINSWQKANIGLVAGILLEPAIGIFMR